MINERLRCVVGWLRTWFTWATQMFMSLMPCPANGITHPRSLQQIYPFSSDVSEVGHPIPRYVLYLQDPNLDETFIETPLHQFVNEQRAFLFSTASPNPSRNVSAFAKPNSLTAHANPSKYCKQCRPMFSCQSRGMS